VTMSAREYIDLLKAEAGRPLVFYPQSVAKLQGVDIGKWAIKRLIGRNAPFPSFRDLKSRGMPARFDCTDAKADLGWNPVSEREVFIEKGIRAAVR